MSGPTPIRSEKQMKQLCELVGIIIGDGCISICYDTKPHYIVEVCGNSKTESDYITYHVAALFEEFTGKRPVSYYHQRALRVRTQKRILFDILTKELEMKPGRKAKTVTIPKGIMKLGWGYIKHTIRGIADTDGSIFVADKPGSPSYPSIEITTISEDLAKQLYLLLKGQGFRATKRNFKARHQSTTYKIGLNGYEMIKKWYEEIGFSNFHKNQKIIEVLVGREGFEPSTNRSSADHSPKLSYRPS